MVTARLVLAMLTAMAMGGQAGAQSQAAPLGALARLPVKEVTVFKDGHAYVIHEGTVPIDADGEVRLDYLPTPILGTFWAYSADGAAPIRQATVSRRRVLVERTALTVVELIQANIGAEVSIRDRSGRQLDGKIVSIPVRTAAELEAYDPPNSEPRLPEQSKLLLLQTHQGIVTLQLDQVDQVTFKEQPKGKVSDEEFRNLLTLSAARREPRPPAAGQAAIGLMYVQKGIRWIPSYQVNLDGKGNARIRMQATLVNEMLDLTDATVHLVIGVPTFAFENTPDPMSLQATFARLSPYFDRSARAGQVLSNAVMSQTARMGEVRDAGRPEMPGELPEIEGQGKSEDLFVFKVGHVTLKKGARMVLPVAEFTLPYKDVHTLDIPYALPPEVRGLGNQSAEAEIARALAAPHVEHKLRITNTSEYPLTTAPALIMRDGRVLAQGMMTYTAVKAVTDLKLTTAVDIKVKRSETETGRTPDALTVSSDKYGRADLTGKVTLTNYGAKEAAIEVRRYIVGHVGKADSGGVAENLDIYSDDGAAAADPWRHWLPWPGWWRQVNGVGRFTWKVNVQAGESVELGYTWHYFWR